MIKKKDSLDSINDYNKALLEKRKRDSIHNMRLKQSIKDKQSFGRYKLYPTNNMYNFLKLDTSKGIITIIQWNTETKKRFEYGYISRAYYDLLESEGIDYSIDDYRRPIGRFELKGTTNNWTFILLDTFNGNTYQVQWGFDLNDRYAIKIN